ncbi:MAG: ABC transporter permease [Oscillospiraceae bacterium]|nr:ABC transporter permease [Oscillospiraceae bacterium]
MFRYIVKRILILIPVIICISIILFAIGKAMPGDPVRAMLPPTLKPDLYEIAYANTYERLGLDKSLPEQYFRWIYNIILKGDLGWSTMNNRPVADAVQIPLRNTIMLNIFVNILYLAIALPVGIKMATKRGSLFDNAFQVGSLITWSVPTFFLALVLVFFFSVKLGWLPMGGMPDTYMLGAFDSFVQWVRFLILPVITLTIVSLAGALRYIRNAMIDALSQDYIRTARSKGLGEKVVIYSHALRNAMIPISTIIVSTLFSLFTGAALTESVFAYNGIGRLLLRAVYQRDTMLIVTMNLFFALISIISVLVSDVIYGLADPRIKLR